MMPLPRDVVGTGRIRRPGASSCGPASVPRRRPFTADDVLFSFQRRPRRPHQIRAYSNAAEARKIDDLTVGSSPGPDPIELRHIANIYIANKAWCGKNGR